MKKILFFLCIAFIAMSAFMIQASSGIHGTITPTDGAKKVWALSTTGTDSISVVPSSGAFSLDLKPGTYKLLVIAAQPYKDVEVINITVEQGKYTDAGEIKLSSGK